VGHNYFHWSAIERLEHVAATGQGLDLHHAMCAEDHWATYQQAMLETARSAAIPVAREIPVCPGADRMLDIGGAHGLYGAALCRLNPPMKSEVLELPAAIRHAQSLARKEGLDDLVSHRAGSALNEDLGCDTFDVVFLGNILHHFTAAQNSALLRRIRTALRDEGTVAVWDFRLPDPDAPPDLVADGFALLFRITSATRCYAVTEFEEWMVGAGFVEVTCHPMPPSTHVLVTGRVK
jgi:SAM-dependent methyltransferase